MKKRPAAIVELKRNHILALNYEKNIRLQPACVSTVSLVFDRGRTGLSTPFTSLLFRKDANSKFGTDLGRILLRIFWRRGFGIFHLLVRFVSSLVRTQTFDQNRTDFRRSRIYFLCGRSFPFLRKAVLHGRLDQNSPFEGFQISSCKGRFFKRRRFLSRFSRGRRSAFLFDCGTLRKPVPFGWKNQRRFGRMRFFCKNGSYVKTFGKTIP